MLKIEEFHLSSNPIEEDFNLVLLNRAAVAAATTTTITSMAPNPGIDFVFKQSVVYIVN